MRIGGAAPSLVNAAWLVMVYRGKLIGREENQRTGEPGRCDAASVENSFVRVIEFDHFG